MKTFRMFDKVCLNFESNKTGTVVRVIDLEPLANEPPTYMYCIVWDDERSRLDYREPADLRLLTYKEYKQ